MEAIILGVVSAVCVSLALVACALVFLQRQRLAAQEGQAAELSATVTGLAGTVSDLIGIAAAQDQKIERGTALALEASGTVRRWAEEQARQAKTTIRAHERAPALPPPHAPPRPVLPPPVPACAVTKEHGELTVVAKRPAVLELEPEGETVVIERPDSFRTMVGMPPVQPADATPVSAGAAP